MMAFVAILAWVGIAGSVAGLLYLAILLFKPRQDAPEQLINGDCPLVPHGLKNSFHAQRNTETGA